MLQALTFYASKEKLGTAGYAEQVEEINRSAVRIAREVAGDAGPRRGDALPHVDVRPEGPGAPRAVVRRLMDEQVALQAAEGVDFFIGETFVFLEEARLCLQAIKAAGYPAMITFTLREPRRPRACPLGEADARAGRRGRRHRRGQLRRAIPSGCCRSSS